MRVTGGTGNGLVKSLLHESQEEYSARNASYVAVKGRPAPLDMSLVSTRQQQYQAFLLLGWGLIADVDILVRNGWLACCILLYALLPPCGLDPAS